MAGEQKKGSPGCFIVGLIIVSSGIFLLFVIGIIWYHFNGPVETTYPVSSTSDTDKNEKIKSKDSGITLTDLHNDFINYADQYDQIVQDFYTNALNDDSAKSHIQSLDELHSDIGKELKKAINLQVKSEQESDLEAVTRNLTFVSVAAFEFKDALMTSGDYRKGQFEAAKKDREKAQLYYRQLKG